MSEWQPIETAPMDRVVLLFPPTWGGRTCAMGKWEEDLFAKKPRPYWRREDAMSVSRSRDMPPTHWMPLPVPPPPDGEA
jgi:hypothetical protein